MYLLNLHLLETKITKKPQPTTQNKCVIGKEQTMLDPMNSWDSDEVAIWLNCIGLANKVDVFRENGVDGNLLLSLEVEDLTGDLGFSNLQAKKVLQRITFTTELQDMLEEKGQSSGESGGADAEEMVALESRLEDMELANKDLRDQLTEKEATIKYLETKEPPIVVEAQPIPVDQSPAPALAPAPAPEPAPAPAPAPPPRQQQHHSSPQRRGPRVIGGAARGAAGGAVKGAIGESLS
jgi:hypothetical protein